MNYILSLIYAAVLLVPSYSSAENAPMPDSKLKVINKSKPKIKSSSLYYSSVEVRHHLNTYYDEQNYLRSQEPSLHARFQLGSLLYGGKMDIYGTLGIKKLPKTQQILQRRPQVEIDIYPLKNENFILRQYNIVKLPYEKPDDYGLEEDNIEAGEIIGDYENEDGTTYVLGVEPTYKFSMSDKSNKLKFKISTNLWTKLFSRRRYLSDYDDDSIDEDLTLIKGDALYSEDSEDFVQRAWSQQSAGFSYSNSYLRQVNFSGTGYYRSYFYPKYKLENDQLTYNYLVKRTSYYKLRIKYEVTDKIAFVNDFYHFFNGMFSEKSYEKNRRFRNIARLTYKM